jgi:predicted enzyme related to lactoylglutathione lyase
MAEFTDYPAGLFNWIDLATTNAEAAKTFYTALFGWTFEDMPTGQGSDYTMFFLDGKEVAALYQMNPQQLEQGMPPHWLSYVAVDDIEAVAAKVPDLNGSVLVEPFPVFDFGQMSLLQDPTGAMFALWQAGKHIGARLVNIPGTLSWNELATRQPDVASEFYSQLFGWQAEPVPDMNYTTFLNQGRMNAGMIEMNEEWEGLPPHWMVYFAVADCDASAKKVTELGGQVHVSPTDIPTGRFAVVSDPQGATFTIIKINNPD